MQKLRMLGNVNGSEWGTQRRHLVVVGTDPQPYFHLYPADADDLELEDTRIHFEPLDAISLGLELIRAGTLAMDDAE